MAPGRRTGRGTLAGGLAAAAAGPALQGSQSGTWNGTYTPPSETGVFLDGAAVDGGGHLLVGRFGPAEGGDSALAIRVDAAGGVKWVWSLQGYGNATLSAAVLLDDGRFLVAGTRRTPEEGPRRFVAALTADGQVAWRDTYGPGRIDDAARVPDGGALLVGGDRATVVTPNGAEIRSERYEDADIEAAARLADGYVLAGATTGDPDRLLLRIDGTGDREWREVRRGDGPDRFTDAVVEGDAVIVAGAAPPAGGTGVRPTVAIYHCDGTREWSAAHRGGADGTGVAIAPAGSGAVAAVPHSGSGRLVGSEGGDSAGVTGLVASPRAVTALGDGRYLVAGERDGDAWAGVVAPGFASPAGLAPADGTDREPDDSGDGDATARDGSGGGTDDGGGRPSVPVGGPSTVVTGLLVAAALVASLVAVAVSVLAWRRL